MSASALRFDDYQFQHHAVAATAETGISYDDYNRMHIKHAVGCLPVVPAFAKNDAQLRAVLLARAWQYCHTNRPMPAGARWEELNQQATAHALRGFQLAPDTPEKKRAENRAHIAAVRRAGGYLQLLAAVAYRSWRLRQNSVDVAASVGMTPYAVRQILWRLRNTARQLGLDYAVPNRKSKRAAAAARQ